MKAMARPGEPDRLSPDSLESFLRRTAPQREAAIADCFSLLCGAAALVGLGLGSRPRWAETSDLSLGLSVAAAYFFAVAMACRRGHYHRSLEWLDAAVENSLPAILFVGVLRVGGPDLALAGFPATAWVITVLVSALRMSRGLTLAAGAFSAAAYLGLCGLALPRMRSTHLEALAPGFVFVRASFILAAGALTAVIERWLIREAERSLRSARAREGQGLGTY
ncbi:MAG: hypothetical protein ACYDCL_09380 [Myxococcales bacterium]